MLACAHLQACIGFINFLTVVLVATMQRQGVPMCHREMEWILEANVRYVKCLGGACGREGIMVACRDGRVLTVFVNNAFPCHIWRHPRPIRYADISAGSSGLAVIDDDSKLTVINLLTGVVCTAFGDN